MQEKCWLSVTTVNEMKLYTKLMSSLRLLGWYQFHKPALPLKKKKKSIKKKNFFFLFQKKLGGKFWYFVSPDTKCEQSR